MRIAIIGGRGFIGTAIGTRLLASGHSVSIFSRVGVQSDTVFADHPQVRWVNGDPFSAPDLRRISHRSRCIGPGILVKYFCNKDLSEFRMGSDANTLYL